MRLTVNAAGWDDDATARTRFRSWAVEQQQKAAARGVRQRGEVIEDGRCSAVQVQASSVNAIEGYNARCSQVKRRMRR